jgi:CubicO group peptidase (beta-lactamase class C family)
MHRRRAIHPVLALLLSAALLTACYDPVSPRSAVVIDLSEPWILASPAEVGLDPILIERAAARAELIPRFRALLVARSGRLVLERHFGTGNSSTLYDVRSVTKSVVSAITGIAIANGMIPELETGMGLFLDDHYQLDDEDRAVSVRHLLEMTSGFEWNESPGPDYNVWMLNGGDHAQFVLDRPQAFTPGTRWQYNSGAVHVLGIVLEHASGMSLAQLAQEGLFQPSGIGTVVWESLGDGIVNGGSGIKMRGQDLLRFGQLHLQRGRSGARVVIPENWVESATSMVTSRGGRLGPLNGLGYGRLWWTAESPRRAYFASGFGGQFVYVVPDAELVVVTTTEWGGLNGPTVLELQEAVMDVIVSDVVAAVR